MIVMMNGYCACLKTTFSKNLERKFGFKRFSTHDVKGNIFANKEFNLENRTARYDEMLKQAEFSLDKGKDIVLDATFIKRAWREKVYLLAKKHKVRILVLRFICSDDDVIRARMAKRVSNNPEDEAKDFYLYKQLLEQEENIFEDSELQYCSIIILDTKDCKIIYQQGSTIWSKIIKELI